MGMGAQVLSSGSRTTKCVFVTDMRDTAVWLLLSPGNFDLSGIQRNEKIFLYIPQDRQGDQMFVNKNFSLTRVKCHPSRRLETSREQNRFECLSILLD